MAREKNINVTDLEIIHGGEILEDRAEIEYCINTEYNPLVVYVPMDIDYAEFKYQAKFCQDKVHEMKKHSLQNVETKFGRFLDLQLELQELMEAIARSVPVDVANQIRMSMLPYAGKKQSQMRFSGRKPYGMRKGETCNPELSSSYNFSS